MARCEFRAVLSDILAGTVPSYALLHRPRSGGAGTVEVLAGPARTVERLAELPVRSTLAILPYRQLAERGLACHDDGTPLVALDLRDRRRVPLDVVLDALPRIRPTLASGGFDLDDEAYGESVRRIVTDEIGRGAGSSFVIRRRFVGQLAGYAPHHALAVFRALLTRERGTYWTFLVHWDGRTLVGASPERHASLRDGVAAMSPISGTFPYPPGGATVPELLRFLADGKEAEELYMVVDEELKMMGRVCDGGGRLIGPRLAEMARLAHTEYRIEGRTRLDARELLRETMFAPTVTGSPLTNACRVITRHEPDGRGYYGGVLALAGWRRGRPTLDSAILIRTADISADGRVEFGVGATLVRRSDPAAEAAETRAKAAGVLGTLAGRAADRAAVGAATSRKSRHDQAPGGAGGERVPGGLGRDLRVRRALAGRNAGLARFWLDPASRLGLRAPGLAGRRVLLVDGEDAFTEMLAHQLRALGPAVTLRAWTEPYEPGYDAVVVGPGPGDPRDLHRPKIATLRALTVRALESGTPLLSICLGHQVLAGLLGLPPRRRPVPAQGERREIDFFGRTERVGFYNTFAAYSDRDSITHPFVDGVIEIGRDRYTGEVHGLRAAGLRSLQFHPESVLTQNGPRILSDLLSALLGRRA